LAGFETAFFSTSLDPFGNPLDPFGVVLEAKAAAGLPFAGSDLRSGAFFGLGATGA
jgi:hypothetical protein